MKRWEMMKVNVLGVIGSPRHGNTEILIREALKAAGDTGEVEAKVIHLADITIKPCTGCMRCLYAEEAEERICLEHKDDMPYEQLIEADGIIVGSPVYVGSITAQTKAFLDRTEPLTPYAKRIRLRSALRNKVGGAISVGANRNAGQETTIQAIHNCFYAHHMILASAGIDEPGYGCFYGGAGVLHPKRGVVLDAVREDELGLKSSRGLGRRVAEVAKLVKIGTSAKEQ